MSKYSGRSLPIITREDRLADISSKTNSEPNWVKDFASNLEKNSVRTKKQEQSLYDQISSIINGNRPKYPSVDAAVKDMQERSGLLAYKNKIEAEKSSGPEKTANDCHQCEKSYVSKERAADPDVYNKHQTPQILLFKKVPHIQNTIDNYVADTRGNMAIPAIIEKVKSIHKDDVSNEADWDDTGLLTYINKKNIEEKKQHYTDDSQYMYLGKMDHLNDADIDPSNRDALYSLNPVSNK